MCLSLSKKVGPELEPKTLPAQLSSCLCGAVVQRKRKWDLRARQSHAWTQVACVMAARSPGAAAVGGMRCMPGAPSMLAASALCQLVQQTCHAATMKLPAEVRPGTASGAMLLQPGLAVQDYRAELLLAPEAARFSTLRLPDPHPVPTRIADLPAPCAPKTRPLPAVPATGPGAMPLTRMPKAPHSRASVLVRLSTAALAAEACACAAQLSEPLPEHVTAREMAAARQRLMRAIPVTRDTCT